jgi:hypothetical protein
MSKKRWVLMHDGTPQMEYLGQTDMADKDIEETIAEGGVIILEECRCLRTVLVPGPEGINQSNILTSNSVARGPISLRIRPNGWWRPDEDKHAMEVLEKQMAACDKNEIAQRAKEAGLVTADAGPPNPVQNEVLRQLRERDGFKGRS